MGEIVAYGILIVAGLQLFQQIINFDSGSNSKSSSRYSRRK